MEVTTWFEALRQKDREGGSATMRAATRVNAEQASKREDAEADPIATSGKAAIGREESEESTGRFRRGSGGQHAWKMGEAATREALSVARMRQLEPREGQAGPARVADRPVRLKDAG